MFGKKLSLKLMLPNWKPLLAASPWPASADLTSEQKLTILRRLYYPVLATPKFDGIRSTTTDQVPGPGEESVPLCRSLLPVPNFYVNKKLAMLPPGLDNEILTYPKQPELFVGRVEPITINTKPHNFNQIQSDIMSHGGEPEFRALVFDCRVTQQPAPWGAQEPYSLRLKYLEELKLPDYCIKVFPVTCNNAEELMEFNEKCLDAGYEGCCFRRPEGPAWKSSSKDGRSTMREQWLVKMKLFEKAEAWIIGAYEEMANNNPMTIGLRGLAERSSHKAGMFGKGTLGGFICKDLETGMVFNVGGGFSAAQRAEYWLDRDKYIDKTFLQYVHQPFGSKDKPRIGIFKAFRSPVDMS